eukprot:SAG22_NODE_6486_length_848_cov_1.237650_2_plen_131_part_01
MLPLSFYARQCLSLWFRCHRPAADAEPALWDGGYSRLSGSTLGGGSMSARETLRSSIAQNGFASSGAECSAALRSMLMSLARLQSRWLALSPSVVPDFVVCVCCVCFCRLLSVFALCGCSLCLRLPCAEPL